MARYLIPEAYHPRLQFRYMVFTTKLPTASIHARSAEQPSFTNDPVTVDFMSGYFKMKGKTKWNDIRLSCYSFEGITENELYAYFNTNHIDVSTATEFQMSRYKHMMMMFLLGPMGNPTAMWKLYGAFIADAAWGNMDYGTNEVIQCDVTITYDYAELNKFNG
jgi:hypothetical protein